MRCISDLISLVLMHFIVKRWPVKIWGPPSCIGCPYTETASQTTSLPQREIINTGSFMQWGYWVLFFFSKSAPEKNNKYVTRHQNMNKNKAEKLFGCLLPYSTTTALAGAVILTLKTTTNSAPESINNHQRMYRMPFDSQQKLNRNPILTFLKLSPLLDHHRIRGRVEVLVMKKCPLTSQR